MGEKKKTILNMNLVIRDSCYTMGNETSEEQPEEAIAHDGLCRLASPEYFVSVDFVLHHY